MKEANNLLMTEMVLLRGVVATVKDVVVAREEKAQEWRLRGAAGEVKGVVVLSAPKSTRSWI